MLKKFKSKKVLLSLGTAFVLLLSVSLSYHFHQSSEVSSANIGFETYTDLLFKQEVSSNTISLQYTLENPEEYGILDVPVTYGVFNTSAAENTAALENCLAALHSFSISELNKANQLTYSVLESYLETALLGAEYPLYNEPLSPLTGVQVQLPILLSEFRLSDTGDVDTYLALISTTVDYFDSLIEFQQAKSKAGLFMSDDAVDSIIDECNSFISMGENNYLYSTFEERLDGIESLTESERSLYIKKNEDLMQNSIFLAYQKLADALDALHGTGTNNGGLCNYPDGQTYYEYVVKNETGSSRSIKELKDLTLAQMQSDLLAIQDALTEDPGAGEVAAQGSPLLETTDPSAILDELEGKMASVFPDNESITNEIKYVHEDIQAYVSPAFYLIPTIDNYSQNVIYINQGSTVDGIDLYTTLAHEGYPGHLYQTTYFSGLSLNPIRNVLNFGGYVEGWATYAEMCSYYLAPISNAESTILQHNASLILGLYALADIGIHYEGWTLMDTVAFYSSYGISDSDTIKKIYNLIVSDPANYLKYYIGYVEFVELKKEAIREWDDSFTQVRFHKAVLDIGPASFDVIRKYIFAE